MANTKISVPKVTANIDTETVYIDTDKMSIQVETLTGAYTKLISSLNTIVSCMNKLNNVKNVKGARYKKIFSSAKSNCKTQLDTAKRRKTNLESKVNKDMSEMSSTLLTGEIDVLEKIVKQLAEKLGIEVPDFKASASAGSAAGTAGNTTNNAGTTGDATSNAGSVSEGPTTDQQVLDTLNEHIASEGAGNAGNFLDN